MRGPRTYFFPEDLRRVWAELLKQAGLELVQRTKGEGAVATKGNARVTIRFLDARVVTVTANVPFVLFGRNLALEKEVNAVFVAAGAREIDVEEAESLLGIK